MTNETQAPNTQITIEQICAAILATIKTVEVPLEVLLTNYAGKTIAINQDEETKALTFTLADLPPVEVADAADTQETESTE